MVMGDTFSRQEMERQRAFHNDTQRQESERKPIADLVVGKVVKGFRLRGRTVFLAFTSGETLEIFSGERLMLKFYRDSIVEG